LAILAAARVGHNIEEFTVLYCAVLFIVIFFMSVDVMMQSGVKEWVQSGVKEWV
jgi:hypothetical protein